MTARITWNNVAVNFELDIQGAQVTYRESRNTAQSASGKSEVISLFGVQEITAVAYFSEQDYRDLIGWWSWARQGKTFSFAEDNTAMVSTTLDAAAAAGQPVIPLTTTTDLSENDYCLIRADTDGGDYESLMIDSISAGVSITAAENLIYSYTSGDTFRHLRYWDDLICLNDSFNPKRTGAVADQPSYYQYTLNFRENI